MDAPKDYLRRDVKIGDTLAYCVKHEWSFHMRVKTVTNITAKSIVFGNTGHIKRTKEFVIVRD